MSKQSNQVKQWRQRFKQRIIDSMGGKCQICGYNKCNAALELHHINPKEKELSFGALTANPQSWKNIVVPELRKCILLCSICHREVHAGHTELPKTFCQFDEKYLDYNSNNKSSSKCTICGNNKPNRQKFCSRSCYINNLLKINWPSNEELQELVWSKSLIKIAEELNISDKALKKRCLKFNIKTPDRGYWNRK